jgi:hypothetical protein
MEIFYPHIPVMGKWQRFTAPLGWQRTIGAIKMKESIPAWEAH